MGGAALFGHATDKALAAWMRGVTFTSRIRQRERAWNAARRYRV